MTHEERLSEIRKLRREISLLQSKYFLNLVLMLDSDRVKQFISRYASGEALGDLEREFLMVKEGKGAPWEK